MTKIKNHIIFETASDVIKVLYDKRELNNTVPPDGVYLVFDDDMKSCYFSGFDINYNGDIFEIDEKVKPEDIIHEMSHLLGFGIYIT